jgi:superfamily I DNA and/or RNA helicase
VALTRARRQLILVLSGDTLGGEPYYEQLLAAAERDGGLEPAVPTS